jgi:pimeloyl-ACP methyl ester carboxylesterase
MSGWDGHEFTPAGGTRMHAAVHGPGHAPTVVCVHGLACSHRYYLPLAARLAPRFRTVAPDLPGFGWTRGGPEAPDVRAMSTALAAWLRSTGRGGATLVGDSTGCQAIIDLAVVAPDLLGPVVLAGPTFDRRHRTVPDQALRLLANGWVDRTGVRLLPIRLRDRYDAGLRRWLRTFLWCLPDPVERKIGRITTPAVVVRGSRDPLVTTAWAEELVGLLPHGRLVVVPGTGHTVNFAAPDELARVVTEASATTTRRPAHHPTDT